VNLLERSLERLLAPLEAASLPLDVSGTAAERPTWLLASGWRVFARPRTPSNSGEEIETFALASGRRLSAFWDVDAGRLSLPFDLQEAHENLVSERWRSDMKTKQLTAAQLDLFYRVKRFIPRNWQLLGRRALIRWQGRPNFPRWPYEDSGAHLLWFYARCLLLTRQEDEVRFRWFWPDGMQAAVVLTHDVESADGLRLALQLADLEQERGFRSSFNIVARSYPRDQGILNELSSRGFELGVHGVYHDRSMFSSRDAFEEQLAAVRVAAQELGASGFRSPATHRVFGWLAELPLEYDCSVPHSDPFEPQPGGCCTCWPFFVGSVVELPYTMPQDHTLFTLLRNTSIDLWLEQMERLIQRSGLIQAVTHPDPGYLGDREKRALYADFLDAVSERQGLWRALPRDVAHWWKQRDEGRNGRWGIVAGSIRATGDGEVSLRPTDTEVAES